MSPKLVMLSVSLSLAVALGACSQGVPQESTADVDPRPRSTVVDAPVGDDRPAPTAAPADQPLAELAIETIDNPISIAAGWGSAFDAAPVVERFSTYSEVVVSGQLVRIGETRLNTESGLWEQQADPNALQNQRAGLMVLTTLHIKVHEVLGQSREARVKPEPGDVVEVTVLGGVAEFTVSPEEAEVTGFRPDISDDEEQKVIDAGGEPARLDTAALPLDSFKVGLETPYFVNLTEGQGVVAFLRVSPMYDIARNNGSFYDSTILAPAHEMGQGILVVDGESYIEATKGEAISSGLIQSLADEVSRAAGTPASPGPLGLFE